MSGASRIVYSGGAYLSYTLQGRHMSERLADAACRIGRGDQNSIPLNGELVSRNHAMIQLAGAGIYYLHDLGSRNGTFLNGKRVTDPQPLTDGDRVLIGGHEIRFHQPPASGAISLDTLSGTTALRADLQIITTAVVHISGVAPEVQSAMLGGLRAQSAGRGAKAVAATQDTVTAVWLHELRRRDGADVLGTLEFLYETWRALHRDNPGVRISAAVNTGYTPPPAADAPNAADPGSYGLPVARATQLQQATRTIHHDIAVGADAFDQLAQLCPAEEHFCQRRLTLQDYPKPIRVYAINFPYLPPILFAARESLSRPDRMPFTV